MTRCLYNYIIPYFPLYVITSFAANRLVMEQKEGRLYILIYFFILFFTDFFLHKYNMVIVVESLCKHFHFISPRIGPYKRVFTFVFTAKYPVSEHKQFILLLNFPDTQNIGYVNNIHYGIQNIGRSVCPRPNDNGQIFLLCL